MNINRTFAKHLKGKSSLTQNNLVLLKAEENRETDKKKFEDIGQIVRKYKCFYDIKLADSYMYDKLATRS